MCQDFTGLRTSIQSFLPPQVSERSDIRQREGEAKEIFIAHIGDRVAPVLQRDAAAIPVVGGLRGGELQLLEFLVKTEAARGTESSPVQSAIPQRHSKLLKLARDLARRTRCRIASPEVQVGSRGIRLRNLQEGVAATYREWSSVVIDQQGAGVDAVQLEVVVKVPLGVGAAAGCSPQARDQRRQMARLRNKCDARQFFRSGEHIPLARLLARQDH